MSRGIWLCDRMGEKLRKSQKLSRCFDRRTRYSTHSSSPSLSTGGIVCVKWCCCSVVRMCKRRECHMDFSRPFAWRTFQTASLGDASQSVMYKNFENRTLRGHPDPPTLWLCVAAEEGRSPILSAEALAAMLQSCLRRMLFSKEAYFAM